MKIHAQHILFAAIVAALASGTTYIAIQSSHKQKQVDATEVKETKVMYNCPMHPQIIRDHPSTCPLCGMDLVPMKDHDAHSEHPDDAVKIEASMIQSIGVKLAYVEESELYKSIKVTGNIAIDPQRIAVVNARSMGWIESNPQGNEGTKVVAGQRLASYYSPDIVAAQEDYLQALRTQDKSLIQSARKRLEVLGISDILIDSIQKAQSSIRTLPITSPISGVVLSRNIVQGQNIMSGFDLYKIADLSHVWAVGKVYPEDMTSLKLGMNAHVTLPNSEGKEWNGKVVFVSPIVDTETKTTEVRIDLRNTHDFILKPGMNADLYIEHSLGSGIAIPTQAVIRTGERSVAIVSLGNGFFAPRNLTLGASLGDSIQVLEGLNPGDSLVTSAQFLIDSESNLKKAVQAFGDAGGANAGHNH